MKKNNKDLQYRLVKKRNLYIFYTGLVLSILSLVFGITVWIEDKELLPDMYIQVVILVIYACYLIYANYSKIKKGFLSRYGVKHKAEIVKAWYGAVGRWGTPSYYLEIDFVNSKGKRKTLHTPAYQGNPNDYLKSAKCSVYEWKGFYVEADLQVHDEVDPFGYAGIPTEKKHFIWR